MWAAVPLKSDAAQLVLALHHSRLRGHQQCRGSSGRACAGLVDALRRDVGASQGSSASHPLTLYPWSSY